jgi:hypothetical protein
MHLHRIALAVAAAFPLSLLAQGIATEAQLKSVQVSGARAPLDPNLPSSTASKTAEQLREQNVYNAEDIAVNLPSTTVRKRYFGDRNANVAGRSYGTLQPASGTQSACSTRTARATPWVTPMRCAVQLPVLLLRPQPQPNWSQASCTTGTLRVVIAPFLAPTA